MSITLNPNLFVSLSPLDHVKPHPINDGHFDPAYAYKVLGVYNASETSECFFILSNTSRQVWFISQRHLRAYKLIECDEFFVEIDQAKQVLDDKNSIEARVRPITSTI
ncbi:hypothetical protein [Pontibacter vulgaris]|uniref:hypothetical protein n=1 Tax=Pontibacter vulgaris TaxID=2905679 RepID=UPI001FA7BC3A|nr:hypothetical protein [Pontibacter vulgaris]